MNRFTLFLMLFSLLCSGAYAEDQGDKSELSSKVSAISEEKRKAYMEEAFDTYDECERDHNYARSYDCKCIASEMYKVRIETDNFFTHANILNDSLPACKDTPRMAGTHYNQCLTWSAAMRRNAQEFCECYGNVMAKNFDRGNFTSARAEEGIMSIAMTECNIAHPKDGKRVNKRIDKKQESIFKDLFSIFED